MFQTLLVSFALARRAVAFSAAAGRSARRAPPPARAADAWAAMDAAAREDALRRRFELLADSEGLSADGWTLRFDRAVRRLGLCDYGARRVSLSAAFVAHAATEWAKARRSSALASEGA